MRNGTDLHRLNKSNFDWRVSIARILRRTALIFVSGVALKWILAFIATGEYNTLENLRIMGVLQRLGICYGIVALLAVTVRHRLFPTIIAVLLVGYYLPGILFLWSIMPCWENLICIWAELNSSIPKGY